MTGNTTSTFEATATDWANGKISVIPCRAAVPWGFVIAIDGVPQHFPSIEVAKCFLAKRAETMTAGDMLRLAGEFEAVGDEIKELIPHPTPEDEMWREVAVRSIKIIRANNLRH
jgi:hypothetical protein